MATRTALSQVTLPRNPTAATEAATKDYTDDREKSATPPLWAFRKRLGNRTYEPVNIAAMGTSTTYGSFATDEATQGLSGQLNRILSNSLMGYGGQGHHTVITHNNWTRAGTYANVNNDFGFQSMSLSTATSSKFTKTVDNVTGFTVYYKQGTTATSVFGVKIDAGSIVNVTPTTTSISGSAYDGVYQISGLTRGSHTIEISWVSGTGTAEIGGVYAHDNNETNGIRVLNCGAPGKVSADFASQGTPSLSQYGRISNHDPALLVFTMGTNDFTTQVALATFKTNLKAAITLFRLGTRRPCSVLLVRPHLIYTATGSEPLTWPMYGQVMAEVAAEVPDVDYLDTHPHWPTSRSADDDVLIATDGIHLTDRGYGFLAQLIADHLLGRLSTDTIPDSSGAAVTAPDPSTLSNLISAWRAASLTQTEGLAVSSWATYAGSQTNPLVQATGGIQPITRLNKLGGYAAVEFRQAISARMTVAALTCGLPATVVVVGRLHRTYGNVIQTASTTYSALNLGSEYAMLMAQGSGANAVAVLTGVNRWAVYVLVYNTTASKVWQTGNVVQNVSIADVANDGFANLYVGSNSSGTNTANMDLVELLVYDKAMGDSEAQGVLDYFARKYGIDHVGRSGGKT